MQIDETELFDMLVAAYKRGAEWITSEVQAAAEPLLNKAAYDYADKTTSQLQR